MPPLDRSGDVSRLLERSRERSPNRYVPGIELYGLLEFLRRLWRLTIERQGASQRLMRRGTPGTKLDLFLVLLDGLGHFALGFVERAKIDVNAGKVRFEPQSFVILPDRVVDLVECSVGGGKVVV